MVAFKDEPNFRDWIAEGNRNPASDKRAEVSVVQQISNEAEMLLVKLRKGRMVMPRVGTPGEGSLGVILNAL